MLVVDVGEHPHDTGHSDRAPGGAGVGFGLGPVGGGDPAQVVLGRHGRSCLPAVVGLHRSGGGVVVEQEAAAADSRGLRLHQSEYGLRGDKRIRSAAAVTQYLAGGLRRQRVRGGHREPRRAYRRHVRAVSGCCLGRRGDIPRLRCVRSRWSLRCRQAVGDDLARARRCRSGIPFAGTADDHQGQREEQGHHPAGGPEPHR